jgi:two-component system, sensor histidine kinase and response regulator
MRLLESLPPSPHLEPGVSPEPRATLLIVDDEEGPRESLKIIFEDDYQVLVASDGLQALALTRQHTVNAAVLDIRMGVMSGIELLEQIKERDPDVAVIMLTAYEEMETLRQALRLGACDYLSKPFDLFTMRSAVAKAVERNRCARQVRASQDRLRQIQADLQDFRVREELARKRGEIYGIVLHDINSPLTVIAGLAAMANEQLVRVAAPGDGDLTGVRTQLAQIDLQVQRCLQISRRYLGFARRQPAERATVQINLALSDLGMLLRPHPAVLGHELEVSPLGEERLVLIHGTDLIQILLNLVINACQSTSKPHRVRVSAALLPGGVDHSRLADGLHTFFLNRQGFGDPSPAVEICVEDDGPGIEVTPIAKAFEAFYTTKAEGEGTGLGLTIVQHLVEQARAGLYVKSVPGKGTRFQLYVAVAAR